MIRKLTTTILSCMLAATVYAEDVDKTLDAASDGHVDVSNIAGSIEIRGWKRSAVQVTGTLGRNVKELVFERDGDKVLIKVKVPRHGGRAIDSDLTIKVPMNSSIDVGAVSADIDVTGVNGDQSLHSVSGDVTTVFAGGDLSAESVSGDVEIDGNNADGDVDASTVSGDVALVQVSGEVKAESVSGDVSVKDGSFDRADLETVNGEIVFHSELRKGGDLKMDTVNGSLDIVFSGTVSAEFKIDTFNGRIRNCFGPKPERTSRYAPGLELEFKEGGGSADVSISTLNGNINLCKD